MLVCVQRGVFNSEGRSIIIKCTRLIVAKCRDKACGVWITMANMTDIVFHSRRAPVQLKYRRVYVGMGG